MEVQACVFRPWHEAASWPESFRATQRRLPAGIALGEEGERRLVEIAAARSKQREKVVADEARKRHGHFKFLGCAQGKTDIFIAELGLEALR